jgi:Uma2 family endonuclease
VYAPPLIIEVRSPSNTDEELNRKRVVAMSAGTLEFWVVDGNSRSVQVTTRGGVRTYRAGESIDLTAVPEVTVSVDAIFEDLS